MERIVETSFERHRRRIRAMLRGTQEQSSWQGATFVQFEQSTFAQSQHQFYSQFADGVPEKTIHVNTNRIAQSIGRASYSKASWYEQRITGIQKATMRERVPTCYGLWQLVLRLISAGFNVGTIALLVRCAKDFGVTMEMGFAGVWWHFRHHRQRCLLFFFSCSLKWDFLPRMRQVAVFPGLRRCEGTNSGTNTHTQACAALFVDLIEIPPLCDPTRTIKRLLPPLLTFLESATVLLCMLGAVFMAMEDKMAMEKRPPDYRFVADPYRMLAVGFQIAVTWVFKSRDLRQMADSQKYFAFLLHDVELLSMV
jgi:hypothetical protein